MSTTTAIPDNLFRMPTLGADMTEGRVVEWLVEPGSEVQRGDLVAVVETDKSDIEIEVFEPCVVEEFLVELGELVDVGTPIARIRPLDARRSGPAVTVDRPAEPLAPPEPPDRRAPPDRPAATARPAPPAAERPSAPPARSSGARRRVTPRARRLAAERGIDLAGLAVTGVVTGAHVLRLGGPDVPEPAAPPAPSSRAESRRAAIADLMARSWATIPHYHVTAVVDVSNLENRLARRNEALSPGQRMLLTAPMHAAIARAAADVPVCNGWWRDDGYVAAAQVDLGIVVALRGGGIIVPTVEDAASLSAEEMMERLRDLVERARRGRLRGSDLRPASLTVTSLGERGALSVSGVIHPPQVALVGVGSVQDRAMVIDGYVRPRRTVHVTVAGDHRAHDGLAAARLLGALEHHLEELP